MFELGTRMMLLPLRFLGLGLQVVTQGLESAQRSVDRDAVERWEGAAQEPGGPPPAPVPGAPPPLVWNARADGALPGGAVGPEPVAGGAGSGVATKRREPKPKEERRMSCCDQDLSGCDLKIVQYSIVSVDPYLKDSRRILAGPETIATSDDMNEADFTAFVLATYMADHDIPPRERQYIRVCYSVQCRLTMPCTDYDKDQVKALHEINWTLRRDKGLPGDREEENPVRQRREGRERTELERQRDREREDQE